MSIRVVEGEVTHTSNSSEIVSGVVSGYGESHVVNRSLALTSFRIGGVPVLVRGNEPFNVAPGDKVVASGLDKNGTVTIVAANNLTAGNILRRNLGGAMALSIAFIVVGGLASLIILGIPILAYGIYMLVMTQKAKACTDALTQHLAHRTRSH